jgi:hypothetical protein
LKKKLLIHLKMTTETKDEEGVGIESLQATAEEAAAKAAAASQAAVDSCAVFSDQIDAVRAELASRSGKPSLDDSLSEGLFFFF